ncbi:MAG TPA: twin-arginine translocase TatA/TatE family subunit [Terriglobales bacterium]|jgi:Sec-independent protein translocase protein TatA|nr:twin-arginine translocase TatA/TatE family subunit [Terriglobales bacterium]
MNFGVSGEMIFLFLLVLILFGPKKMPEIGRQVARLLNEFRRASNEFRSQIESEVNSLDASNGRGSYGSSRQPILPSLQAPLGSLANRIFNPPSPEKLQAVEDAATEDAAVKVAAAESVARKAAAEAAAAPEPSAAAKVAPDA